MIYNIDLWWLNARLAGLNTNELKNFYIAFFIIYKREGNANHAVWTCKANCLYFSTLTAYCSRKVELVYCFSCFFFHINNRVCLEFKAILKVVSIHTRLFNKHTITLKYFMLNSKSNFILYISYIWVSQFI